jgi:hypothetical protein
MREYTGTVANYLEGQHCYEDDYADCNRRGRKWDAMTH